MIQAAKPNEILNPDQPHEQVSLTVPGFGNPVTNPNFQTNNTLKEKKLTPEWQKQFFHWWHKIALVLLIIHGLVGIWESIYFTVVDYPELSHQLELHQVGIDEVNQLISRAIITFVTTFVNVLFAVRLSKVKETTAHNIDLIVATFLIITTKLIQNFLVQLDLLNYFIDLFTR